MNNEKQPIFMRIKTSLIEGIESGFYARGSAIPSEPELSRQFNTTRMTVRRAIDTLVVEGKLYRVHGKGTFVSNFELSKTYQKHGFSSNMLSLGIHPSSRVLIAEVCEPPDLVRTDLELNEGEPVFFLKRIRLANDEPIAIERVWLPFKQFPNLVNIDFSKVSLYETLRKEYNLQAGYSRQKINAVMIEGEDAQLLFGAETGVALRMRNVDYEQKLRPIATADSLYHGTKYTFDVII